MKILITGGSGMVGRNLLEHKASERHLILAPTRLELDLLDRKSIVEVFAVERPDMVIHAAGVVGGIQANISNPVNFLRDNIDIGVNVISAAQTAGIKYLINLGSSCMYPRDAINPLKEDSILTGKLEPTNEGYALSKIIAARLCEYIVREDSGKSYKTIIPCNLYGRHDKFEPEHSHLIPAVIRKLDEAVKQKRDVVDIWGDGLARREFMTAHDLSDLIYFCIDNFRNMPQTLNAGLGHDYSINEYYEAIALVVGYTGVFENDLSKPVGMQQKLVDIEMLNRFGWHHKTELLDGIKLAYDYYKDEY